MKYRVKGIISAECPCEHCGNTRLERSVVLERSDGEILRVGKDCAGKMILGKKSRKNSSLIEKEAKAHSYAKKWIEVYGDSVETLIKIAEAIRVKFCPAAVYNDRLHIGSEIK